MSNWARSGGARWISVELAIRQRRRRRRRGASKTLKMRQTIDGCEIETGAPSSGARGRPARPAGRRVRGKSAGAYGARSLACWQELALAATAEGSAAQVERAPNVSRPPHAPALSSLSAFLLVVVVARRCSSADERCESSARSRRREGVACQIQSLRRTVLGQELIYNERRRRQQRQRLRDGRRAERGGARARLERVRFNLASARRRAC